MRTPSTPTRCGPIPSSRWRSTLRLRSLICARSRRFLVWRTCRTRHRARFQRGNQAHALLRMGRAMVELYCASFASAPECVTLDIDDTFDAVHGGQQLALFNAHCDEYGFQPIVVFDGQGRFVTAVLRPAKRPGGKEIKPFLRRLLRAIRAHWPRVKILLRADSHYCAPEVLDFCRANGVDYILGVAPTSTLRRHVETLEASTKARYEAAPQAAKLRIPIQSGHRFRFDVGRHSDLKPATVPK